MLLDNRNLQVNRLMKRFLWILKLAITAGMVGWLLSRADLHTILDSLTMIQPLPIIFALALQVIAFVLAGLRWWVLLTNIGLRTGFRDVLSSNYLGIFFNNLLPTGMGGDVVRVLHMKSRGSQAKELVSSAIADRVIGLVSVLILGVTSVFLLPNIRLSNGIKISLAAIAIGTIASLAIFSAAPVVKAIRGLATKYGHTRVRRFVLESLGLCQSFRSRPRVVMGAFVLTLVMQSIVVLVYYTLGTSIGIGLSIPMYFAIIPMVFLAANIPISIGGLGVREGTLIALMVAASTNQQLAITLSILYLTVLWTASLPGAFALLGGIRPEEWNRARRAQ